MENQQDSAVKNSYLLLLTDVVGCWNRANREIPILQNEKDVTVS